MGKKIKIEYSDEIIIDNTDFEERMLAFLPISFLKKLKYIDKIRKYIFKLSPEYRLLYRIKLLKLLNVSK
jgi:hypothetical protein